MLPLAFLCRHWLRYWRSAASATRTSLLKLFARNDACRRPTTTALLNKFRQNANNDLGQNGPNLQPSLVCVVGHDGFGVLRARALRKARSKGCALRASQPASQPASHIRDAGHSLRSVPRLRPRAWLHTTKSRPTLGLLSLLNPDTQAPRL
ncbi:hypothetical protein BKA80DRAFT_135098 [Phyllosticta citrichinensis]